MEPQNTDQNGAPTEYTGLDHVPTVQDYAPTRTETATRQQTSRDLARIETLRLAQRATVGSTSGPVPQSEWLPFGDGKEYPPLLPDPEKYVVGFDGENDPLNPQNWPTYRKYVLPRLSRGMSEYEIRNLTWC